MKTFNEEGGRLYDKQVIFQKVLQRLKKKNDDFWAREKEKERAVVLVHLHLTMNKK